MWTFLSNTEFKQISLCVRVSEKTTRKMSHGLQARETSYPNSHCFLFLFIFLLHLDRNLQFSLHVNAVNSLGGLLYTRSWNNMQYVTSATFALAIYYDYLTTFGQQLQCPNGLVPTSNLLILAKTQVNLLEESKLSFIFNNCYLKANCLSYQCCIKLFNLSISSKRMILEMSGFSKIGPSIPYVKWMSNVLSILLHKKGNFGILSHIVIME